MNNINVDESDDNMSATTAGISITSSQIPTMPIELVIPPPQSRVVKEGWVYKRGFILFLLNFLLNFWSNFYFYLFINYKANT